MQRALLLDDERIERSILQAILIEANFEVRALSLSMKSRFSEAHPPFDIAILDLSASMRNESQIIELCDTFADAAILIMTDNGAIEQILRLSAGGAVNYIRKPFSKEEFLGAVERTIQHTRVLREKGLRHDSGNR